MRKNRIIDTIVEGVVKMGIIMRGLQDEGLYSGCIIVAARVRADSTVQPDIHIIY